MVFFIFISSDFDSFPLFFMYGQYFYSNDQGEFAPAEIAIVRFTFKHGIIQRFHSFVAPGNFLLAKKKNSAVDACAFPTITFLYYHIFLLYQHN